jgi:hypothetical protein
MVVRMETLWSVETFDVLEEYPTSIFRRCRIQSENLKIYVNFGCVRITFFPAEILGKCWSGDEPTPRSWGLLEKPLIAQPLNFLFYGTRTFIAMFGRTLNCSISWARSVQAIPPYPIYLRSILILPSHLRPGLPNDLFWFSNRTRVPPTGISELACSVCGQSVPIMLPYSEFMFTWLFLLPVTAPFRFFISAKSTQWSL